MSRRSEQISEDIKHRLNDFLIKVAEVPAGILITITNVRVTEDLELAFVSLSVLPVDKTGLATSFFKRILPAASQYLNQHLKLRRAPQIRIEIDEFALKHRKVERALENIN